MGYPSGIPGEAFFLQNLISVQVKGCMDFLGEGHFVSNFGSGSFPLHIDSAEGTVVVALGVVDFPGDVHKGPEGHFAHLPV